MTVKDKDGKVIEGLTAKDFVVTEDGQPQDIAFVEFQRLATEVPAQPPTPQAPTPLAASSPPHAARRSRRRCRRRSRRRRRGDIRYQDRKLLVVSTSTRRAMSARRPDPRLHQRAEIHRDADDAVRPGGDHGLQEAAPVR